jgi:PKD repeat protein
VFSLAVSADPIDLSTPYTMSFEVPNIGTETGGFTWTTKDANNDGFRWNLSTGSANNGSVSFHYLYNPASPANDWLFSPCLTMDGNQAYRISFFDKTGRDAQGAYPEKLEIKAGTSNTVGAMNEMVSDLGALIDTGFFVEHRMAFKPATSAVYYLGFHCYSDADEFYLYVDDVTIDILPLPNPVFVASLVGDSVRVTDGSDDFITDWVWTWGDGSAPSTGQDPGIHHFPGPGTYTICLKVTNLAGSDSVCQTVTVANVGIDEVNAINQISVYPNPTNRILNVAIGAARQSKVKLEIVNVLGETLISRETTGNSVEKFELDKLSQGVYFVRITGDGIKTIRKFVYAK